MRKSAITFAGSIGAAVAAGIIATFVITMSVQTETIVVSTHHLDPYKQIQLSDVKMETVPAKSGIQGLATNVNEVVGKYLSYGVPAGYPVTASDVKSSASFSAFLTQYVETNQTPGMELSIPVQSDIEKVINPGDKVALLVKQNDGSFKTIQPVLVLNTLTPSSGSTASSLLVFVTEQDYNVLAPAILRQNVQVGLIPQNGSFTAPDSVNLNTQSSNSTQPTSNSLQGGQ